MFTLAQARHSLCLCLPEAPHQLISHGVHQFWTHGMVMFSNTKYHALLLLDGIKSLQHIHIVGATKCTLRHHSLPTLVVWQQQPARGYQALPVIPPTHCKIVS